MTLDVLDARHLGARDELLVQGVVLQNEGHVHEGAVLFAHRSNVEIGAVEVVVQDGRLLLVELLDALKATLSLEPLEDLAANVNGVARRRVEHGALVGLGFVLEHGGNELRQVVADQILADDDDGGTGRADVLLDAAVDKAVLLNVDRLGQEAGAHIGNQNGIALGLGILVELGAIDGLVVADVDVVGIFANLKLVDIGNVSEVLVLRGSSDTDVAVLGGFLASLLAPGTGKDIVGLALLKKVHGNGGELRPSATLQEENLVIVGNTHQITQIGLSLVEDLLECLGAMGHLHNGHARAAVIQHLSCGLLKHADGKRGGTGGKVVNPCHVNRPFNGVEPEARRWCNTPTLTNLAQARRFF